MQGVRGRHASETVVLIPCVAMLFAVGILLSAMSSTDAVTPFGNSPTATYSVDDVPIRRGPVETAAKYREEVDELRNFINDPRFELNGEVLPARLKSLLFPVQTNEWRLVEAGNAAYDAGNVNLAMTRWHQAQVQSSEGEAFAAALFNSGLAEMHRWRFRDAIRHFGRLLSSVDTAHADTSLRNDMHYACRHISACYHALADDSKALAYAEDAQQKYPLIDWCGVWLASEEFLLDEHIALLKRSLSSAETKP